jgi:hypothetical protein
LKKKIQRLNIELIRWSMLIIEDALRYHWCNFCIWVHIYRVGI